MLLALALATATPTTIYGMAQVSDGDSISIGPTRIRLFGIDAPESEQMCKRAGSDWACGQAASDNLKRLVDGRDLRCDPTGTDQYGRVLARCYLGARDINREQVSAGMAVAYRRYSLDYVPAEIVARAAKRGLWTGTFQMPSDFRHSQAPATSALGPSPRRAARAKTAPSLSCVVKGNRSRRGEWIYHLPGMPYYEQTRPEEIFCSEAAARAAGYRRAIVR